MWLGDCWRWRDRYEGGDSMANRLLVVCREMLIATRNLEDDLIRCGPSRAEASMPYIN